MFYSEKEEQRESKTAKIKKKKKKCFALFLEKLKRKSQYPCNYD